jgi:hypothetical protein
MAKVDELWSRDNPTWERDVNGHMSLKRLLSLLDHPPPKPTKRKGRSAKLRPLEVPLEINPD